MSNAGRTVYVIGAGIAGLTLALALAKFGTTVVVLEKSPQLAEEGAGIQISPNASRALDRLGVGRAIRAAAFAPQAINIYPFRRIAPLVSLTLGKSAEAKFGSPYFVIHRAELARILHQACRRFANIDIRFGVRAVDLRTHARGLSLLFEDASGETRTVRPFAAIGADGVHSSIRTDGLGGAAAQFSGYVAWRAMLDLNDLSDKFARDRTSLLWAPGFHAVTYPVPTTDQMNVVLFSRLKEKDLSESRLKQGPKLPKFWLKSAAFDELTARADGLWTGWPVNTVPKHIWNDGPVGLIGDAAHAMLPFQAQGAAMAIEDAAVLAPLLVTEADAASALSHYASLRRKRVGKVAKLSQRNGFAFHHEWPFTIGRDMIVSLQGQHAHLERLAWLYNYDPTPEVDTGPERT